MNALPKMYSIGFDDDLINRITLSIPYSVTNGQYVTYELSVTGEMANNPRGLASVLDGSKTVYIRRKVLMVIYAYNITYHTTFQPAVIGTDSF